jgi:hypothetical protein
MGFLEARNTYNAINKSVLWRVFWLVGEIQRSNPSLTVKSAKQSATSIKVLEDLVLLANTF